MQGAVYSDAPVTDFNGVTQGSLVLTVEAWELVAGGPGAIIFQPITPNAMADMFGMATIHAARFFCDWPDTVDPEPIKPGYTILFPDDLLVTVAGTRAYPGHHVEVYVQMPYGSFS